MKLNEISCTIMKSNSNVSDDSDILEIGHQCLPTCFSLRPK